MTQALSEYIITPMTTATNVRASSLKSAIYIKADDSGSAPTQIEILRAGMWDAPYHGMFMVTNDDLNEYIQNFNDDIRPSSSTHGLPIDLDHDAGAAVGWIKSLYIGADLVSLWANVEWTPRGQQIVSDGEYKFFSPEFAPDGYVDPEGIADDCDNVLIGGGLTNRPLFKDLTPVTASDKTGDVQNAEDKSKIFIKVTANDKESHMPTLEEVRVKEASALTQEEKDLLTEHKADLTADELKNFGFEASEEVTQKVTEKEVAPVTASDKTNVTISASELDALKSQAAQGVTAHEKLMAKEASDHVNSIAFNESKGFKLPSDMREDVAKLYLSANDEQKVTLDKMLDAARPLISASDLVAQGSGGEIGTAKEAMDAEIATVMAADKIDRASAILKVTSTKPELANAYNEEQAGK